MVINRKEIIKKIIEFFSLTFIIVFAFIGSSPCLGNKDNIYVKNIENYIQYTERGRALAQLNGSKVDPVKFENYRQNIYRANHRYSNAYRLSTCSFSFEINGYSFSPNSKPLDFSYNQKMESNDTMIFSSIGETPKTESECEDAIIIDNKIAQEIIDNCDLYSSFSDLVNQEIIVTNEDFSNEIETQKTLKIVSVFYLVNEKPKLDYVNWFIYLSHGSSFYISKESFNELNFNNEVEYYTNFNYDISHGYPFNTFGLTKELLGSSKNFTFPDTDSNLLQNQTFSKMSEITIATNELVLYPVTIIVTMVFLFLIIIGFFGLFIFFFKNRNIITKYHYLYLLFLCVSIFAPIGLIFLFSKIIPNLFIMNVFVPIVGQINTLIYVACALLFLLVSILLSRRTTKNMISIQNDEYTIIKI